MADQTKKAKTTRSGIATIELAIILPLLLMLILAGLDFALQFHVRHRMIYAAREGARCLAVRDGTPTQAQTAALNALAGFNADFSVTTTEPAQPSAENQDVRVTIAVPRSQVSLGVFGLFSADTITIQTIMRKER